MPNLDSIDISQRTNNSAVLKYHLSLPLGKTKKYRLKIDFQIKDNSAFLSWKILPWPELSLPETIKDTTGYWILKTDPKQKNSTLVLYHVYTDPGPIPFGLGWIVDILTENSIPDVMLNTRERVYSLQQKNRA